MPQQRESAGPVSSQGVSPGGQRFYHPELDALRALGFVAVFQFHIFQAAPELWADKPPWYAHQWWIRSAVLSGAFSLDMFFVLSSFLITSLLIREMDTRGRLDVRAFWVRRILRIWPLYFTFLLAVGFAQHLSWAPFLLFGLFVGNWAALAYDVHDFAIGPLWSVSVEEQFYFAWPLVLLLVPRRRLPWVCAGLIACALATRVIVLGLFHGSQEAMWVNTFARLDGIAIGALIALRWHERPFKLSSRVRVALGAGAVLAVVCSVRWVVLAIPQPPFTLSAATAVYFAGHVMLYLVAGLASGALIVASLSSRSLILTHPALVYLGRISYGLYVFHVAALQVVGPLWWPWRFIVAFPLTLLAASVSYRFLEQAFLRLKDRFTYIRSSPLKESVASAAKERAAAAGMLERRRSDEANGGGDAPYP